MSKAKGERELHRREQLGAWSEEHGIKLERLDLGQQWVLYAALELVQLFDAVAPLKRLVGYFLAHCGMGLGTKVIAAVVATSDRAVRQTKALTPEEVVRGLRNRGHRKQKLQASHAGVVAKYLAEHPTARAPDILAHIEEELGIAIDRLTLRRYLKRYGLGCLRGNGPPRPTPLFSEAPPTEAPFC